MDIFGEAGSPTLSFYEEPKWQYSVYRDKRSEISQRQTRLASLQVYVKVNASVHLCGPTCVLSLLIIGF